MGRLIEIPHDGQVALSTGVVSPTGHVDMELNELGATDGYMVTLSPETLHALRPGVSLASLPRVGGPPDYGARIYEFGFAAWANIDAGGQYRWSKPRRRSRRRDRDARRPRDRFDGGQ